MNRGTIAGGLLASIVPLLALAVIGWLGVRELNWEVGHIAGDHAAHLRLGRELRSSLVRFNSAALALTDPAASARERRDFVEQDAALFDRLAQMRENLTREELALADAQLGPAPASLPDPDESPRPVPGKKEGGVPPVLDFETLAGLLKKTSDDLLQFPADDTRRLGLIRTLTMLTGEVGGVNERLMAYNENTIAARQRFAAEKAATLTRLILGTALLAAGVHVCLFLKIFLRAPTGSALKPAADGAARNDEAAEPDEDFSSPSIPAFVLDRELRVRRSNAAGAALARSLGQEDALPEAVQRRIEVAIADGARLPSRDVVHLVVPEHAGASAASDFLLQIFRLPDDAGAGGWSVLLVDVTALLRTNDGAKNKALATLGHEVKTPVAGIRLSLHLLLEEKLGTINKDQRELLEVGRENCERLLNVLQALLELARFESGRTTVRPEPQAPGDLWSDVIAARQPGLQPRGIELRLDPVPAALPLVLADLLHANRVLEILVDQAARHHEPGAPLVAQARAIDQGKFVRFSVTSAGRSFTAAEQEKMFEPFFRRPGDTGEDTGLDLAIAREIATQHGGRVGVTSPPDAERVEFFFDLPRAD